MVLSYALVLREAPRAARAQSLAHAALNCAWLALNFVPIIVEHCGEREIATTALILLTPLLPELGALWRREHEPRRGSAAPQKSEAEPSAFANAV